MSEDYRNTKYCPKIENLSAKKKDVKDAVLSQHPRAKDMHTYISPNDSPFKKTFLKAYNEKCSYCGVSLDIIPSKLFEIDHFIPRSSTHFGGSKAKAGDIDNLVLSCYDCNRAKGDWECPNTDVDLLHPDKTGIISAFVRDDDYYIRINDEMRDNETIKQFYYQVDLGKQLHRLDYLLMNMLGLREKMKDKQSVAYAQLSETIGVLQRARNRVG